mmetsp:Transcript_34309/g.79340  ORF Transcript_34309/g.79340 Transcript_34309/m.79340 type:complete len:101 (+) Transcript_34309:268-570(+)
MSTPLISETPTKDSSRDDRLKFTNQAEHALRKELSSISLERCQEETKRFAVCAKAAGLGVIFKCRRENDGMNACLSKYNSEEEFEKYRAVRGKQLAQEAA